MWAWKRLGAEDAWDRIGPFDPQTAPLVAIVDSGIADNHEDLEDRLDGPRAGVVAQVEANPEPGLAVPDQLAVAADEGAVHMAEGAKRQLGAIGDLISAALGHPVGITVVESGASTPVSGKSKRLSEKDLKADKLREFRAKDAALDAAADVLDLEIVD